MNEQPYQMPPAAGTPVPPVQPPMYGQPIPMQPGVPMQGVVIPGVPVPGAPMPGAPMPGAPMPVPPVPPAPPATPLPVFGPGKHHVSRAFMVIQMVGTIVPLIIALFASLIATGIPIMSLFTQGMEAMGFALLALLVVVAVLLMGGLSVLYIWLSWRNLTYELTPKEFSLYSGVIFKKRVHVPYQKIQSIDQSAGVFKRIFGLCDLKVETAGGSDNTAINIPCVKTMHAEILRTEIFRRKNVLLAGGTIDEMGFGFIPQGMPVPGATTSGTVAFGAATGQPGFAGEGTGAQGSSVAGAFATQTKSPSNILDMPNGVWDEVRNTRGDAFVDTGRVLYERGMSNIELLWAGLSGSTMLLRAMVLFLVMGVLGLTQVLASIGEVWLARYIPAGNEMLAMAKLVGIDTSNILLGVVLPLGLGVLGLFAVAWILSIIGTVVSYGGFRVRRRETRIEVEHGLLRHVFQGVDVNRVQNVVVTQTFIRRLFGYCEVTLGKIDSVSADSQKEASLDTAGMVVYPCVKIKDVPELIAGILPEYADQPTEFIQPPRVGLRRAITRHTILYSPAFWTFAFLVLVHLSFAFDIWPDQMYTDSVSFGVAVFLSCLPYVYALFALVFIKNIVKAVLWYRQSGIAYNRGFIALRNGGYHIEDVLVPRQKIQFGYTTTNPFQRHARVSTVCVRTAARFGQTLGVWDIAQDDAETWLEWVRPHAQAPVVPVVWDANSESGDSHITSIQ